MSGQAIHKFQGTNASPTLVVLSDDAVSTDAALCAWLESLLFGGANADAIGAGKRPENALWAVRVANSDPAADTGTAYFVSHEAAKRVRARRYP